MERDRCWSSIVAGPADRAALRIEMQISWPISCELPAGHSGPHASDGGRGGTAPRPWLLWGDFARTPQARRELPPCAVKSIDNSACTLFDGHGGPHAFAMTAPRRASARPRPAPASGRAAPAPAAPAPRPAPAPAARPSRPGGGLPAEGVAPGTPGWGFPMPTARSRPVPPPATGPAPRPADPAARPADPAREPATAPPARHAVDSPDGLPGPAAGRQEKDQHVGGKDKDKHGKRKRRDEQSARHERPGGRVEEAAGTAAGPENPLGPDDVAPAVGAHALSSMIQINDYADATRTSLIEVIDPDGRPRTVVAPVTAAPAEAQPPVEPEVVAPDVVAPEVPVAVATEVAGLTAIAAQAASAIPDDQFLVRRQVADALQDVAAALAKLADSLDPR